MDKFLEAIPGAQDLFDWFGYWPSFHDAEVLGIEFNRTGASKIRVHTWRMTAEVDARGFYVCDKHCIVTLILDEIVDLELAHFNSGNILMDIEFAHEQDAFILELSATYGLEGKITAKKLAFEMVPGIPADSQYRDNES
jgi:Immunity protein 50